MAWCSFISSLFHQICNRTSSLVLVLNSILFSKPSLSCLMTSGHRFRWYAARNQKGVCSKKGWGMEWLTGKKPSAPDSMEMMPGGHIHSILTFSRWDQLLLKQQACRSHISGARVPFPVWLCCCRGHLHLGLLCWVDGIKQETLLTHPASKIFQHVEQ